MGTTMIFVISLWWVRLVLLTIAMGVTFHLLRIPTFKIETPHT